MPAWYEELFRDCMGLPNCPCKGHHDIWVSRSALAEKRARALLMSYLPKKEQWRYHWRREIHVATKYGLFRIRKMAMDARVTLTPTSRLDGSIRFCVSPKGYLPPSDQALTYYLLLTTRPQEFMKIANRV